MKSIYKVILLFIGASFLVTACDTDAEIKDPENLTDPARTEEYYAALRAYKKTDHPVAFGWFGNWVGSGVSLENSLRGLPDSVDFVSLWGNWKNPSIEKLEDLHYVQNVKGTRAMVCFVVSGIGDQITPSGVSREEFWGYTEGDDASVAAAVERYANAICDTIDKYGYDGFDYDYEPHYGGAGTLTGHPERERVFIETIGKRCGPQSGTGRLFVIDGEPDRIESDLGVYFDYFISQAYRCTMDASLDNGLRGVIKNFDGIIPAEKVAKMFIVCENFESYAANGGVSFTDRYGNQMMSLEGMARWQPLYEGEFMPKGGIGTYHMEYEYNPGKQPSYPALRKGIQLMNPSIR